MPLAIAPSVYTRRAGIRSAIVISRSHQHSHPHHLTPRTTSVLSTPAIFGVSSEIASETAGRWPGRSRWHVEPVHPHGQAQVHVVREQRSGKGEQRHGDGEHAIAQCGQALQALAGPPRRGDISLVVEPNSSASRPTPRGLWTRTADLFAARPPRHRVHAQEIRWWAAPPDHRLADGQAGSQRTSQPADRRICHDIAEIGTCPA